MRIVADTNVLVSALLWCGPPRDLLIAAEHGVITLWTSPALLDELSGVLVREKFSQRLRRLRTTPQELPTGYVKLAHIVIPHRIPTVAHADPDNNLVLACADRADAAHIVTGDASLLALGRYQRTLIVPPALFRARILG